MTQQQEFIGTEFYSLLPSAMCIRILDVAVFQCYTVHRQW